MAKNFQKRREMLQRVGKKPPSMSHFLQGEKREQQRKDRETAGERETRRERKTCLK